MAAQNEIQYYSALPQFDLQQNQSNVNLYFHKIINCEVSKPSIYQQGHQLMFDATHPMHGDKGFFGFRKRDGFVRSSEFPSSLGVPEHEGDTVLPYNILDINKVGGIKYALIYYPGGRALLQYCFANTTYECEQLPLSGCNNGQWIKQNYVAWEGRTINEENFYSKENCIYDKILTVYGPKGPLIAKYEKCIVQRINGTDVIYCLDDDGNRIDMSEIGAGNWVYIEDNGGNIATGQMIQTAGYDVGDKAIKFGSSRIRGIRGIHPREKQIREESLKIEDDLERSIWLEQQLSLETIPQKLVTIYVYPDVGEMPAYADEKGIIMLTNNSCKSGEGEFLRLKSLSFEKSSIQGAATFDGNIAVINSKGVLTITHGAQDSRSSHFGVVSNSLYINKDWNTIVPLQQYLLLFGAKSMGIAFSYGLDKHGNKLWRTQTLLHNVGLFSKDAVINQEENIYLIDNDGRYVLLNLLPVDGGLGNYYFKVELQDMSNKRVNSDFRALDRSKGDRVSMAQRGQDILIFMRDNTISGTYGPPTTKVMIYNRELRFWHWWYLSAMNIRGYYDGCWYGQYAYCNKGNRDNANPGLRSERPITQTISMMFGDSSPFTYKNIASIKTNIGHHSRITRDTTFSIHTVSGGRESIKRFAMNNVDYIKKLNQLYGTGENYSVNNHIDFELNKGVLETTSLGRDIKKGNGIGHKEPLKCTLAKDTDAYTLGWGNYIELYDEAKKLPYCKDKVSLNAKKRLDESDDSERDLFFVAKQANIKTNLGLEGENFYFEISCVKDDEIEFNGRMLIRTFMDNSMSYLENVTDYPTTPPESKLSEKHIESKCD